MGDINGWIMLICNPIAGGGRSLGRLAVARRALEAAHVPYAHEVTRARGHAVALARSAIKEGCGAVVAIGGDGTFFEVVNGVVGSAPPDAPDRVAVGLLQAGRGSDFGRSAGVPMDINSACQRLIEGRTEMIDLGHITYRAFTGEEVSRYFANAAGMGFDAEVSFRANSAPRILGGTIPYLSSLLLTLGTFRNKHFNVLLGGENGLRWSGKANSIVVANGQYFGGGMRIAPDAALRDGEFDVVILGDFGKVDLVRNVPRVYDGSHVTHPKVTIMRAARVEARSPDRVMIQADGETLGTPPAVFTVARSALRLIV